MKKKNKKNKTVNFEVKNQKRKRFILNVYNKHLLPPPCGMQPGKPQQRRLNPQLMCLLAHRVEFIISFKWICINVCILSRFSMEQQLVQHLK